MRNSQHKHFRTAEVADRVNYPIIEQNLLPEDEATERKKNCVASMLGKEDFGRNISFYQLPLIGLQSSPYTFAEMP